ncbi:serine threonine kinase [Fusarium beomiforme]|uniref:Serine threonine kinase n=1 Tax=Fusarium beomiforme TaxID=44412 RepID=A0A9P5AJ87_9HYPO|nr:serine threonine kinase [Fusarium beomiforme]
MSSAFEYNSSFTFSHPGWDSDPITDFAEIALAQVAVETQPGPIEDFTTFAQQLHSTGLPICGANDLEDINHGASIGAGTTMTVFKCLWKSRNKVVAVKRVNLGIALGHSQDEAHSREYSDLLKSLLRELRVMNHPWGRAHPNFVDLLGVSWDIVTSDEGISSYRPAMIVELADSVTPQLRDLVTSSQYPLALKEQRVMFDLLTDVAEGVTMLHAMKIVHGDLKPDNILLFQTKDRLVAKLSDFGFCSPFTDAEFKIGGTLYWNAPECMPDAPEQLRIFRSTITRDLYSFGLIALYSLFGALPYGDDGDDTDIMAIQDWKLHQDASVFLHQQIAIYAPGLHVNEIHTPVLESLYGLDLQENDLLWFQIWVAMTELLRKLPNARNIAMGHIHSVFKTPKRLSEVLTPQIYSTGTADPISRPKMVSSMSHGLQNREFGKFDPFRLDQIPAQVQRLLFEDFESRYSSAAKGSPEEADLALVLSNCHHRGFGCPPSAEKARDYETVAAQAGSDAAQIRALFHGLLDGFDPSVTDEQRITWLKTAVCIFFLGNKPDSVRLGSFRDALERVPADLLQHALLFSFTKFYMVERIVYNLEFDGAAQDDLYSLVVNDERDKLAAALKSDRKLLHKKKGGFTLLHVAADYCREEIIQELVQSFSMHPDLKSDHGDTPIERAAETGSVDCVRLLISLGAGIKPLADQDLFSSVVMTGSRHTIKDSPAHGTAALLLTLCKVVEEISGDPKSSVALVNGKYLLDNVSEGIPPSSPLELALSVLNYDSVIALLNLGADPNVYNYLTPLQIAVSLREPLLTLLLLTYGALPNTVNSTDGHTALHCANEVNVTDFAEAPRNDIVPWQKFVKDGVDAVDVDSNESVTARMKACIKILLHFGADLEARNSEGETPLVQAVRMGDYATAEYLLEMGADIKAKDKEGNILLLGFESEEVQEWYRDKGLGAGTRMNTPVPTPPFFGGAGHTEIFEEAKNCLSQLDSSDTTSQDSCTPCSQSSKSIRFKELPPSIQQSCLALLGCVFGPTYERLIAQGTKNENRLWSNLTVPAVINSLESTFGSSLNRKKIKLEMIAEQICNNTARPFQDIDTSSQKWTGQLCGSNLRWESIGLLWSVLRRIPGSFEPIERNKLHVLESGTANKPVLAFLRHSINLARHFTLANVIILDLLFQKAIMESMIVGDASLVCYGSFADAVSMMTYLGVHAEKNIGPYKPSLSSEHKRRLFGRVYNLDKAIVAFTGRPPLLNPRFCSTPPPLDLSDEDLLAGGYAIERAVSELDHRGWNVHGGVYPSSICRAGYLMAVILNEIIDISLGSGSNATVETIRYLKQRQLDAVAELPKCLVYDLDDPSDLPLPQGEIRSWEKDLSDPPVETNVVSLRIFIRLTHLQNMFLLERLLLQYGSPDEGDVLLVSFEMITLTLMFWMHKDRFRDIRRDMEWLLMAFAVPGGGILCLELLSPTFQGKHPKDNRLSRSSIVQQLSLLVGFLDWVHPSAPNGDLCASCKTVIQRVLDYHLNNMDPITDVGSLDQFSSGLAGRLNFRFELLNTFDWLNGAESVRGWST